MADKKIMELKKEINNMAGVAKEITNSNFYLAKIVDLLEDIKKSLLEEGTKKKTKKGE